MNVAAARPISKASLRARAPSAGPAGHFHRWLSIVASLAIAVRLGAIFSIPTRPVSDFWNYRAIAMTLAETGAYPLHAVTLGPGYPVWLAFLARLGATSILAERIGNALLAGLSAGLAGLLGRRLAGDRAGLIAAAVFALEPRQILQAGLLASENLATPLIFGFLLLALAASRRRASWRLGLIGGLVLGIAALTRFVAAPLALLWPATALVSGKRVRSLLVETTALVVALFAVLLPWSRWTLRATGRWSVSPLATGIDLFEGNHAGATGSWSLDWVPILNAQNPPDPRRPRPIAETDRIAGRLARSWIREHPLGALHLYSRKLGLYFWKMSPVSAAEWAIDGDGVLPRGQPWIRRAGDVRMLLRFAYFLLLAAGAGGLAVSIARLFRGDARVDRAALMLVAGAAAIFPALTCVFAVVERYRWPFEDLLCVLASALVLLSATAKEPAP